jgi:thiamine biosynthesis lipoprotein
MDTGARLAGDLAAMMSEIHLFEQRAMATTFQVRIANEERTYALQAAQAAFAVMSALETHLSRFRVSSDIAQVAQLLPGAKLRLSEPAFACLALAKQMEAATGHAFSATPAARQSQPVPPQWSLIPAEFSVLCERGKLEFDLGAIGKGFALDRMAATLRDWDCPAFLLVAGGSSILAGDPPRDHPGWSCGLGEDHAPQRYWLTHGSLSGSGIAVKGRHIFDPRTGRPAQRESRVWALCDTAAESDALSTAAMVLDKKGITEVLDRNSTWLVFLDERETWRCLGRRALPARA